MCDANALPHNIPINFVFRSLLPPNSPKTDKHLFFHLKDKHKILQRIKQKSPNHWAMNNG